MERELPTIEIEETVFIVDVNKVELREKANPNNFISFFKMLDAGDGYVFDYSHKEKNIPLFVDYNDVNVKIPELVSLDPVGMAQKYNLDLKNIEGKTDFELMVDQDALDKRVNKGMLPVVDIAGYTFYVDMRMDMLRPKDDFTSKGIVFSDIKYCFNRDTETYLIPYNPKTHEFQEIDYDNIISLPKDLIAIKFKHEADMDRVGWNRHHGDDPKAGLKEHNVKMQYKAKVVPWEKTLLPQIITENVKQMQLLQHKPKQDVVESSKPQSKKGRKM